jgi:hypothetical protein
MPRPAAKTMALSGIEDFVGKETNSHNLILRPADASKV